MKQDQEMAGNFDNRMPRLGSVKQNSSQGRRALEILCINSPGGKSLLFFFLNFQLVLRTVSVFVTA